MTIHPGSTDLLAAVPTVVDGLSVRVQPADGGTATCFGTEPAAGDAELRAELPVGSVIASFDGGRPGLKGLARALLGMVADRERLESDIESMSTSSLRLMERVYELVEALPQLSAGTDDHEIAHHAVRACQRAASVQQVIYLRHSSARSCCEVVVHFAGDDSRAAAANLASLDPVVPTTEGFITEVLAAEEGVVLRTVADGERLGVPGSPEHLATRQILGVPVTFGSGDKRVVLGALLLVDKRATTYANEDLLGNEEGQVAESFAAMLGAVLGARKTAELGKELTMARVIQRQILPSDAARLPGFDVAAEYRACGAVGGDYFDFVPLADGRTLVVIADVSGHNLASGMMMVSARAMLRTLASVRRQPAQVFEDLAAAMYEDLTRTERFLTAAGIAVRSHERTVEYVNAGHNDLFVYRAASDRVERVASDSTILGFLPRPDYMSRHVKLDVGDALLLFTDGITETVDAEENMFGDDRLAALFAQLVPGRSSRGIVDGVLQEIDTFRRGLVGTDDITVVVMKCVESGRAA